MQLVLVTTGKENTNYTVYDNKVVLASFILDKPEILTPVEVEQLRVAKYDERA